MAVPVNPAPQKFRTKEFEEITMTKISLWKRHGLVMALLLVPGIGSADVVTDWNTIMIETVRTQTPFAQARFAAITQLAVFEAVNAVIPDYKPYLGTIAPQPDASAEAAAVAAAHRVLSTYFPGDAAALDAARDLSLAGITDGPAKEKGIVLGEAAANAMIALRANDGSANPMPYTPQMGPGYWQPTPPAFGPGVLLHWGSVAPFGILSSAQFRADPPPTLTSSRYTRDFEEVKAVGDVNSTNRPADRADVARFYAITAPVRLWNGVAQQIVASQGYSLPENARMFALINMAISDGAITVFESKYFYEYWRPVTAIRAADTDGNPKTEPFPDYTPYIVTPPFPSYPSAHGTLSNAGSEVLRCLFGNKVFAITISNPDVPGVVFHYTKLRQITDNISDARVYGGIHFRFDQDAGETQGREIGAYVFKHKLRYAKGDDAEGDDE